MAIALLFPLFPALLMTVFDATVDTNTRVSKTKKFASTLALLSLTEFRI